jgi:hypothetical protein
VLPMVAGLRVNCAIVRARCFRIDLAALLVLDMRVLFEIGTHNHVHRFVASHMLVIHALLGCLRCLSVDLDVIGLLQIDQR